MGAVVAAHHLALDSKVALKFLLPELIGNEEAVARFTREARVAAKLRGEHVARVLDVGLEQGAPFIVMELLEGVDLHDWLTRRGPLPVMMPGLRASRIAAGRRRARGSLGAGRHHLPDVDAHHHRHRGRHRHRQQRHGLLGLYSDGGGVPGSVVMQGTSDGPPNSNGGQFVSPTQIGAGTYWLAATNVPLDEAGSSGPYVTAAVNGGTGFPQTWPSPSTSTSGPLWVEYLVGTE
jgi:hypothetical protein